MSTTAQIIQDLKHIADVGESVELLNLYKGLPIVNRASFANIGAHDITLNTNHHQLVCLVHDGHTVILSDILQVALSADVAATDQAAGAVTLNNLAITTKKVGDRMTVRVEPHGLIPVEVSAEGQTASGAIADISLNGVGLLIPGTVFRLKRKMPVQVIFQLPNARIESAGLVRYTKQEAGSFRAGIDISQDVAIKARLAQYISGRRAEILDELDRA